MQKEDPRYPCPCCGYIVFTDVGGYEICPICAWEDDISQLRLPTTDGGCNQTSLIEAQIRFQRTGVSNARFKDGVRKPSSDDHRDSQWRPLIAIETDNIEVPDDSVSYESTYPEDRTQLFYWRNVFWRKNK